MAITSFQHGRRTRVLIDGLDCSPVLKEATAPLEYEEHDTTTFDPILVDKTYQRGNPSGALSLKGFWKSDPLGTDYAAALDNAAVITVGKAGIAFGGPTLMAYVFGTKAESPNVASDLVEQSADYRAMTGVRRGNWIKALAGITAGGTGTTLDNGAATAGEWAVTLHATDWVGSGTLGAKVYHSVDGSTWVELVTLTSLTDSGAVYAEGVGTVERYRRIVWTFNATSANIAASLSTRVS